MKTMMTIIKNMTLKKWKNAGTDENHEHEDMIKLAKEMKTMKMIK